MDRNSTHPLLKAKLFLTLLLLFSVFASHSQTDLTRPTIISVSPAYLSLDAGTAVSAVFSEAMNPATISTSTFELRNVLTGSIVPAAVVYNAATRTARLYPFSGLNSFLYTAKVKGGSSGVRDLAGNAMVSDYYWTFLLFPIYDFTAPSILSVSPANGATGVSITTKVSAVFSESMNASTINTSSFELRNSANVLVPATVSYNSSMRTATLTPSNPLANSTLYRATIKSTVKDINGNALPGNYTWSFSTVAPPDVTAPVIIATSPGNGATGISTNTSVSAIFSEAMNAATINSSSFELRNSDNVLIPSGVSYNAAAKKATLTPLAPLSNLSSYTATVKGGSAGVKDVAGNAMANHRIWSFTTAAPADATPPVVLSVSPDDGSHGVAITDIISAVFSEPMNAATINNSTVQLFDNTNTLVAASVNYNAAEATVVLTPSASLMNASTYTAKIKAGSGGVKDLAGNPMTSDYTWSFSTTPISIFQPEDVPEVPFIIDQPAEIGVKFNTSHSGYIIGLRFYKGAGNEGAHIGHLWSNTGVMLAEAVFTNETQSGWQEVLFTSPVAITPGVTYVASYFSGPGIYSYTNNYFTDAVVNGPIRALADGEDGGNGVYSYSPASAFPTSTFMATNYFVDVMFVYAGVDFTRSIVSTPPPSNNTKSNKETPAADKAVAEGSKAIRQAPDKIAKVLTSETQLFARVMPNPSATYFNLVINSNDANPVMVRVMDLSGRVIETYTKISSSGILKLGHNWGAGTYFAELIQGNQKKVVKMIKVN